MSINFSKEHLTDHKCLSCCVYCYKQLNILFVHIIIALFVFLSLQSSGAQTHFRQSEASRRTSRTTDSTYWQGLILLLRFQLKEYYAQQCKFWEWGALNNSFMCSESIQVKLGLSSLTDNKNNHRITVKPQKNRPYGLYSCVHLQYDRFMRWTEFISLFIDNLAFLL